jgi:hypothetical protein
MVFGSASNRQYILTLALGRNGSDPGQHQLPSEHSRAEADSANDLTIKEYELKLKEYRLKVDEKVRKLLELQQNLVIFLITGAVGSVGYSLSFAVTNRTTANFTQLQLEALGLGAVLGLMAALAGLISLFGSLQSMRLDIKYSNQDKDWKDLTERQQRDWDGINRRARVLRSATPILLALCICSQAAFFGLVLVK